MNLILISLAVLGVTGLVAAVLLYFVAQKFKVFEDPRIDTVCEKLPGANCGGCGFAGCRALAEAIVKEENLENKFCPVGGTKTMEEIAVVMNLAVEETEPKIAVVRCNGGKCNTKPKVNFEGFDNCLYAHMTFASEGGCSNGCLGLGNCVKACNFDAIHINPETQLPEVDEEKCVACGACVKTCPRSVIELRNKGKNSRRVFVSCINQEKGAAAKKNCESACIGCGKCVKACPFEAISINNNVAYIDFNKCKLCRKCVAECPTGAIHAVNFPIKKEEKPQISE